MVKLHSTPKQLEGLIKIKEDIIGPNPSLNHLDRWDEIFTHLNGIVKPNEFGEIEMKGYPIPKSNLVKAIRFLVKGGHTSPPKGVIEIAELFKAPGNKYSIFTKKVRDLLMAPTSAGVLPHLISSMPAKYSQEDIPGTI